MPEATHNCRTTTKRTNVPCKAQTFRLATPKGVKNMELTKSVERRGGQVESPIRARRHDRRAEETSTTQRTKDHAGGGTWATEPGRANYSRNAQPERCLDVDET